MAALCVLLSVVAISIIATRVSMKALEMTGLSRETAHFQARTIFTGTGYSTSEAEQIMRHPVRRRIAMVMMLLQNAGLVTVISMVILSFMGSASGTDVVLRGGILVGGLILLGLLARSTVIERLLGRVIEWALERFTELEVRDYHSLLNLEAEHAIGSVKVNEDSWLAGRTLQELDMAGEGVMVLCISRPDGSTVCPPQGRDTVEAGDALTVYGHEEGLEELSERRAGTEGNRARREAEQRHREAQRRQSADGASSDGTSTDGCEGEPSEAASASS